MPLSGPEEYHFVNQGDCYDLRKVEDEDEFVETKQALKVRCDKYDIGTRVGRDKAGSEGKMR